MQKAKNVGLTKENTAAIKGILALVVVIAHCRDKITALHDTALGALLTASGYLVVGVFFFLSAYGLREQLQQKGRRYLDGFLRNRVWGLYATYLLAIGIYLVFDFAYGNVPQWQKLLQSLIWGGTIVENGWYIQAALLFYVLFWWVYHKEWKYNFLLILLLYGMACLTTEGTLWIQSALGFGLGLWWSENKPWIDRVLKKHWYLAFALSFLLFCATLLPGHMPTLPAGLRLTCKMLSVCFFAACVAFLAEKVSFQNGITNFLGNISYEIYVIHGLFLTVFRTPPFAWADIRLIPAVFACAIPAAWVLHRVFRSIQHRIRKEYTRSGPT